MILNILAMVILGLVIAFILLLVVVAFTEVEWTWVSILKFLKGVVLIWGSVGLIVWAILRLFG